MRWNYVALGILALGLPALARTQPTSVGVKTVNKPPVEKMPNTIDSTGLPREIRARVRATVAEGMRDPSSLTGFKIDQVNVLTTDTLMIGKACGRYNARNGYGGMAGTAYFVVQIIGNKDPLKKQGTHFFGYDSEDGFYRDNCGEVAPIELATWVGWKSKKTLYRNQCFASGRVPKEDREMYWIYSAAIEKGYVRSEAPGC